MARQPSQVKTLTHEEAKRKNLPTAEHQSLVDEAMQAPMRVAYQRRNKDLDTSTGKLRAWVCKLPHEPALSI